MVRPNNKRLEQILNDLTEVTSDLNISLVIPNDLIILLPERLNTLTEKEKSGYITKVKDNIKRAFRGDIINLFTSVEEYLAFSLKASGFSVSNKNIRECLSRALMCNTITQEFQDVHLSSLTYRNNMAHRYNEPTTEELIEWWRKNNKAYTDLIEYIKIKHKTLLAKDMNYF